MMAVTGQVIKFWCSLKRKAGMLAFAMLAGCKKSAGLDRGSQTLDLQVVGHSALT